MAQGWIEHGDQHLTTVPSEPLGECPMSGPRYDRILASTALALILTASLGTSVVAQQASRMANAPTAATPAAPPPAETTAATPATTAPTDAAKDAATPAASPAADPMAALDPADRPIAERIRDLLAAKSDKIFASRKERAAV